MRSYKNENLSHDPIHGYIPFTSDADLPAGEVSEREIIDHPWVQRMRLIHQLQTAWWVFPTAEHTRFQHVVGVMHLASRATAQLYESLKEVCPDAPSLGYVESLLRMAGLLHDVGHGPFGHFFDEHFLKAHGETHETLSAIIIQQELGDLLRSVRRNPNSQLLATETLDPAQIAWLITRPKKGAKGELASEQQHPQWLHFLRSLLSGQYTIDNMDFVLRDAYMSGYSQQAYDIDRLLHFSFFSEKGLTIHDKGMSALMRFIQVRGELFRTIYYHRTVKAIDLALAELFVDSRQYLFPGNPREHLAAYLDFSEMSLLVDVRRWRHDQDPAKRQLGERWESLIQRKIPWVMIWQHDRVYGGDQNEKTDLLGDAVSLEQRLRRLRPELAGVELKIDIHRTQLRQAEKNFLYDSATQAIRPLTDNELFSQMPISHLLCRVYARNHSPADSVASALDELLGKQRPDDATNM